MINTVEKIYTTLYDGTEISELKVTYSDGSIWHVSENSDNRHYQAIQEGIAEGNTVIDNGAGQ